MPWRIRYMTFSEYPPGPSARRSRTIVPSFVMLADPIPAVEPAGGAFAVLWESGFFGQFIQGRICVALRTADPVPGVVTIRPPPVWHSETAGVLPSAITSNEPTRMIRMTYSARCARRRACGCLRSRGAKFSVRRSAQS